MKLEEYRRGLSSQLELGSSCSSESKLDAALVELGPTLRYCLRATYRIVLTALEIPIRSCIDGTVMYGPDELDYDMTWLHQIMEEANDGIAAILKVPTEVPEDVPPTERSPAPMRSK